MFNFMTLVPLLKSALPGLLILAEAFRYGLSKHGGETWKDKSPSHHVGKATKAIGEFAADPRRYSLLADAGLRLVFALCLLAAKKPYVPKDQPVEEKPSAYLSRWRLCRYRRSVWRYSRNAIARSTRVPYRVHVLRLDAAILPRPLVSHGINGPIRFAGKAL